MECVVIGINLEGLDEINGTCYLPPLYKEFRVPSNRTGVRLHYLKFEKAL